MVGGFGGVLVGGLVGVWWGFGGGFVGGFGGGFSGGLETGRQEAGWWGRVKGVWMRFKCNAAGEGLGFRSW